MEPSLTMADQKAMSVLFEAMLNVPWQRLCWTAKVGMAWAMALDLAQRWLKVDPPPGRLGFDEVYLFPRGPQHSGLPGLPFMAAWCEADLMPNLIADETSSQLLPLVIDWGSLIEHYHRQHWGLDVSKRYRSRRSRRREDAQRQLTVCLRRRSEEALRAQVCGPRYQTITHNRSVTTCRLFWQAVAQLPLTGRLQLMTAFRPYSSCPEDWLVQLRDWVRCAMAKETADADAAVGATATAIYDWLCHHDYVKP